MTVTHRCSPLIYLRVLMAGAAGSRNSALKDLNRLLISCTRAIYPLCNVCNVFPCPSPGVPRSSACSCFCIWHGTLPCTCTACHPFIAREYADGLLAHWQAFLILCIVIAMYAGVSSLLAV